VGDEEALTLGEQYSVFVRVRHPCGRGYCAANVSSASRVVRSGEEWPG
jgi:hypothetical protein